MAERRDTRRDAEHVALRRSAAVRGFLPALRGSAHGPQAEATAARREEWCGLQCRKHRKESCCLAVDVFTASLVSGPISRCGVWAVRGVWRCVECGWSRVACTLHPPAAACCPLAPCPRALLLLLLLFRLAPCSPRSILSSPTHPCIAAFFFLLPLPASFGRPAFFFSAPHRRAHQPALSPFPPSLWWCHSFEFVLCACGRLSVSKGLNARRPTAWRPATTRHDTATSHTRQTTPPVACIVCACRTFKIELPPVAVDL